MKYTYLLADGKRITEPLPKNKSVLQRMGDLNAQAAWEADTHPHDSETIWRADAKQGELPWT